MSADSLKTSTKSLPWPGLGTAHEVPALASSAQTFAFLEKCLDHCNKSHKYCNSSDPKPLPTRLVDVGRDDEGSIHLVESRNIDKENTYIALSHCWGERNFITTTKATLAERMMLIKWTHLSAVFQDAIFVARRLGVRYIWIDSLCIIQDSQEDWELESSCMGQVYANAYFTIAATGSPDGTASFLNTARSLAALDVSELDSPFKDLQDGTIQVRRSLYDGHRLDGDYTFLPSHKLDCQGPLMQRAWAWQERILSRRIIQYTTSEVKWQCSMAKACECDPITYDGGKATVSLNEGRTVKLGNISIKLGAAQINAHNFILGNIMEAPQKTKGQKEIYFQWQALVTDFSGLDLTYPSDMLPACSGVASLFENRIRSTYLAGLWRDNLAYDIAWVASLQPRDSMSLQPRFRVPGSHKSTGPPSWSWTSVTCKIGYNLRSVEACVTILKAQCILEGQNPFGEVENGFLEIKGRYFDAQLRNATLSCAGSYVLHRTGKSVPIVADCLLQTHTSIEKSSGHSTTAIYRSSIVYLPGEKSRSGDEAMETPIDATVKCLIISFNRMYKKYQALVLGSSLESPGCYQRLGFVELLTEEWLEGCEAGVLRLI